MYDNPSERQKVKCYGSSAALTVEATRLGDDTLSAGHTVNLELARKHASTGFNWSNKITIQLSEAELVLMACVCMGYLPEAKFQRPNKGLTIQRQPNKLYVTASQGRLSASLPLPIGQVSLVSMLVLQQLLLNMRCPDSNLMIASIRGAAALYSAENGTPLPTH
jgi:hypothetical protein